MTSPTRRVELNLPDRPLAEMRVVVSGVDLAKITRSLSVDAGVDRIPTISLDIMAPMVINADAIVRVYLSQYGLRDLLTRYRAQHTETCNQQSPKACTCGLVDFLNGDYGFGDRLTATIVVDTKTLADEIGRRIPEWLADHARRSGRL